MNSSVFTLGLKEIYDAHLKPTELYKILECMVRDIPNQNVAELPLDVISMYMHNLFVSQNPLIRAQILKMIMQLEIASKFSIIEKYNFDKLIANSLEQKTGDTNNENDEEKTNCFSLISVILRLRNTLPKSIIRALISLYSVPKHNYKNLILSNLATHCLHIKQKSTILADINRLIVDSLGEGIQKAIPYIIQQAEDYSSPARSSIFLSDLLVHVFQNKLAAPKESLIAILHTWAGLLYYGIEKNILQQIFLCIPSEPSIVVSFIKGLLNLSSIQHTILTPYRAYLMTYFTKKGFIDSLSETSGKQDITELYNQLIQLSCTTTPIDVLPSNLEQPATFVKDPERSSSEVFTFFNIFSIGVPTRDLQTIVSGQDPLQWDWTQIHNVILRVLPFDESLALGSVNFYDALLNFFTNQFVTLNIADHKIIADVLDAFFDFLMIRDYGFAIIASSQSLRNTFLLAIHNLTNNICDESSPLIHIFKNLCQMSVKNEGSKLLLQWEIVDVLFNAISNIKSLNIAKLTIQSMKLFPVSTISNPMYQRILMHKNKDIAKEAILGLFEKSQTTPMFHMMIFLRLLVPYVKYLDSMPGNEDLLNLALNLMTYLMIKDQACIIDVMGDSQMHKILSVRSHVIYSLLLSREESLPLADIDKEIDWWLDIGNLQYVSIYDHAVKTAFSEKGKMDIIPEVPSEVVYMPPHLFGQLSKTQTGLMKLSTVLPRLIQACNSSEVDVQRGALFAIAHLASQASETIVSALDLATIAYDTAMKSDSYTLKGTLVVVLSLFAKTNYLSKFLESKNWQLVTFNGETIAVPNNPEVLIKPAPDNFQCLDEGPRYRGSLSPLIMQLANIIMMKSAKSQLVQIYREHQEELMKPDNALAAMEQLAEYSFSNEARMFVYGLFRSTSLVPLKPFSAHEKDRDMAKVRIYEGLNSPSPQPFSQIQWQKYNYSEIPKYKICRDAPEQYLKDEVFEKALGVKKEDFYKLSELEKRMIRTKLL